MKVPTTLLLAACTTSALAGEIQLEVAGCQPGQEVRVALYNWAAGFSSDRDAKSALREQAIRAESDVVRLGFSDLPAGRYAVAAFQDRNGNHKLDSNFVGMPTELYGFSRDARNLLSAPSFEQAAFELGDGSVTQLIHLK
ncbi:MAG: DUF2141 domain-containing protein [Nitrosomonadales bacterium]|nr:DUF2141 domain-containing protein [Nitrosomonadales bacterium]